MIWNLEAETMPREEKKRLQLQRMQLVFKRAYHSLPFYRRSFEAKSVKPEDLKSLEDLSNFPFTLKTDLRDNYPFGLFATPMSKIIRLHASSGTTGKPVVGAYTRNDLDLWSEVMARSYGAAGVDEGDMVHNAYGYGLFTGGMGFHYGAERIGATVVPVAGGLTKRQVMLWQDFKPTVLTCTPSFALVLAETAAEMGINPVTDLNLRVGMFGAEPWTEQMRHEIESKLGLEAFNQYGLTELIGPGVSCECPNHNGMHIQDDHFYPEIIDPATGEVLDYGQTGELVFTSLTKEAFPVIRYRTRDITSLDPEPCSCGRTTMRMNRITGRSDDMLIVRGVNVFPSQIEGVILTNKAVAPVYLIVVDRVRNLDQIEVQVEAAEAVYHMGEEMLLEISNQLQQELVQTLGISAKVVVVPPRSIARSEGKAKRVLDRRNLHN
ncbi:phenylacetate--CoA ligase [Clostridiales bacterium PH28_bin88]|nr:phenylacetate--CoA ligase [Clostridiales bacterium PH28_bin88]